jgi:mono/diheme cytochrome c family protein
MPRHQLAADELWLGIGGPSDASWTRGAHELATMRIPVPDSSFAPWQDTMVDLATRAETSAPADRVEVYAEILANCADCHGAVHGD